LLSAFRADIVSTMRPLSSWGALGCLVLACSSSADPSGSGGAAAPPFVPGASTTNAPPATNSGSPAEASGSEGSTGTSEGNGSSNAGSASPSEQPSDLPLDGEPQPAPEGSDPSATPPAETEPTPGSTDPSGTDPSGSMPPEADPTPPVVVPPQAQLQNVLVFTRTTGFRHGSIEPGVQALQRLGQENGFAVERTEDPADFTDERLARYDVVVWLNTDSEVMNENGRRAFERYIRAGGGWVGVHAASATEQGWAWYGQLIGGGAFFRGHPAVQPAQVNVEIADHPSTQHLPQAFTLTDEWYSFRANPRSSVQVLMTLSESSYGVGELAMGDHPIAWYHEFDGGRAWYTALGHPNELYTDSRFTQHLLGGIRWAAGAAN
jgi:cytochrome c